MSTASGRNGRKSLPNARTAERGERQPRPPLWPGLLAALALAALVLAIALPTGLARKAFHAVYERLAGVEVLGPNAVRVPPQHSPYQRWLASARETIPVFEGFKVGNISEAKLGSWAELGPDVRGLYLRLTGYQQTDARIVGLPAEKGTSWQRHFYEQAVYALGGPGHTEIERAGRPPQRVEWSAGSLLSVPLNARYRHVNDSGAEVRLLVLTSFPFMLNTLNDATFIENDHHDFTERYDGSDDYFESRHLTADDWLETNFVADIRESRLADMDLRGPDNDVMHWTMAGNSMLSLHVSGMPPGARKKAHRHSNEVLFLVLSGAGTTLAWPGNRYDELQRIDWREGTLFSIPPFWYHQHMNTGSGPARYFSANTPDLLLNLGLRYTDQLEIEPVEIAAAWARIAGEDDHARR